MLSMGNSAADNIQTSNRDICKLLFCLLEESPNTSPAEYLQDQENQKRVVYAGRDPELELVRGDESVPLRQWAQDLLAKMADCAVLFDTANGGDHYARAVSAQREKILHPELTPSARILKDMEQQQQSFGFHGQRGQTK